MIRPLFLVTGLFLMLLGGVLLVVPSVYLAIYIDPALPQMDFAARRFAPAVIGLGAVLVVIRSLRDAAVLRQFALITAAVWIGVAATGIYAYGQGVAGFAIVVASGLEAVIGLLFVRAAREIRRET